MEIFHTPVMPDSCLKYLSPLGEPYEGGAWLCDSTLGEGGHSAAFLSNFPTLNVIGIDADSVIQKRAKERLSCFGNRMHFYNGWFDDFYAEYPDEYPKPNLILFDLGISVFHYEKSGRGFSFRHDEALDMRLSDSSGGESAFDIVNGRREEELSDLIYLYGEEKFSRRIARAIVEARGGGHIRSSATLAKIIWDAVPEKYRHAPIHPATRTFQALRIAVNGELRRIPLALQNAFSVLTEGGKMGVITFHSLEDRIVKNYFRNLSRECVCPPEYASCKCGGSPCAVLLEKKPVEPSLEEVKSNPPSRSAKFRVIRKIRDANEMRLFGVEGY